MPAELPQLKLLFSKIFCLSSTTCCPVQAAGLLSLSYGILFDTSCQELRRRRLQLFNNLLLNSGLQTYVPCYFDSRKFTNSKLQSR